MYTVSKAYIASMAADLREMPSFSVVLYNADVSANAALSFAYDPEPLQRGEGLNSFNKIPSSTPRATLERNWLRANGRYSALNTGHYIGAGLSDAEANADGVYEYDAPDTVVVSSPGSTKPISFVLDPAVAVIEITRTDGTAETISLDPGERKQVLAINDDGVGDLSLRILASFYPYRRPRIYGIYAANVFNWDCEDIVDIDLEDENDLMCLELPGRSVKLRINNLDGKLNPHTESVTPTFQRKATQAMLTFSYEGKLVPIGRLFLDTYTVDKKAISFSFGWATLPLGDSIRSLSTFSEQFIIKRIKEILSPEIPEYMTTFQGVEEDTAAEYAITTNTDGLSGFFVNISNPYPITDRATCLQLLCNAANILMRPGREDDIAFLSRQTEVVRRLRYDELTAEPEYTNEEEIHGASVTCYDHGEFASVAVDSVTVYSDRKTRIELTEPTNLAGNTGEAIYDDTGEEIGLLMYQAQGYVMYMWCEMYDPTIQWSQPSGTITYLAKKLQKNAVDCGSAPRKKIDNPLITSDVYEYFWPKILQDLSQHATVSIEHRGFPELDCGDLIEVQLENGGEYIRARVIQNKWEFKSGVLSGKTKLRLATGVG